MIDKQVIKDLIKVQDKEKKYEEFNMLYYATQGEVLHIGSTIYFDLIITTETDLTKLSNDDDCQILALKNCMGLDIRGLTEYPLEVISGGTFVVDNIVGNTYYCSCTDYNKVKTIIDSIYNRLNRQISFSEWRTKIWRD